jgi:hypothetical protein
MVDEVLGTSATSGQNDARLTFTQTLQELIAPKVVGFFDKRWQFIGEKVKLHAEISQLTGIDKESLVGGAYHSQSVAHRMSWAAKRQATREEDIAYSLLGLFNVNMPLMYGEGAKAFRRLQEEIIKSSSNDQTIFASGFAPVQDYSRLNFKPFLRENDRLAAFATHPNEFLACQGLIPERNGALTLPFSVVKDGIQIQLSLIDASEEEFNDVFPSYGMYLPYKFNQMKRAPMKVGVLAASDVSWRSCLLGILLSKFYDY